LFNFYNLIFFNVFNALCRLASRVVVLDAYAQAIEQSPGIGKARELPLAFPMPGLWVLSRKAKYMFRKPDAEAWSKTWQST